MALLFIEGFDWLNATGDLESAGSKGTWYGTGISPASYINRMTGRDGTGYALTVNNTGIGMMRPLSGQYPEGVVGFGYQCTNFSKTAPFMYLWAAGNAQLGILRTAGGLLSIIRSSYKDGNPSVTLATGTTVIGQDEWHYIEFKYKIDNTTGTAELHINGHLECSVSAADTMYSSDAIDAIGWHSYVSLDDIYFCDTTGSKNNDFLGDCFVQTLRPDGDSAVAWTKSAGANNYENVDEAIIDDDTTYNYSSTAAQKDLYTFEDLPSTPPSVHGVQLVSTVRKEDIGVRTCKQHINSGADLNASGVYYHVPNVYQKQLMISEYTTGTTEWDETTVNGVVAGVEII